MLTNTLTFTAFIVLSIVVLFTTFAYFLINKTSKINETVKSNPTIKKALEESTNLSNYYTPILRKDFR